MKVSFEEFAARFADLPLSELSELVERETGKPLRSRSKASAMREAYDRYCASVDAPSAPAAPVLDAGAFDAPPPASPPPASSAPAAPVQASGPVVYEARSKTGRAFHKIGLCFGPKWEPIGELSEAELSELQKFARFVDVRIRG